MEIVTRFQTVYWDEPEDWVSKHFDFNQINEDMRRIEEEGYECTRIVVVMPITRICNLPVEFRTHLTDADED